MADFQTRISSVTLKDGAIRQMQMADGIQNLISGLGGRSDSQSYSNYFAREFGQQEIDAAFRSSGICRRVHSIPATDSIRAGWAFKTKDADINAIEGEQRRLGLANKLRKAELISRLYGGSAIMMGVGTDNPATPLDINRVKQGSLRYLHVLSRYQLTVPDMILDPGSPYYGMPSMYGVNTGNGQQIQVHPSRMVRFVNSDLTEENLWQNSGWGDSTLTYLWTSLINSDTAQGSFAALLNKAKTDVITIPKLAEIFATKESEDRFKQRLIGAQLFEGIFGIKLIGGAGSKDDVGETWQVQQLNWTGAPEIMDAFGQAVSSVSGIPFTKLWGRSPGGLNSTGDHDLENYLQEVSAGQELSLRPRMEQIFDVLYRSALGSVPSSGIWFDFLPLKIESEETRWKNAKVAAETAGTWADTGLVPTEVAERMAKTSIVEGGMFPGAESAYTEYEKGLLEPIVEVDEDKPDDPLIPVDQNGNPTQNRESRLFAANDMVAVLLGQGHSAPEAVRLSDARPRPLYVQRKVLNVDEIKAWAREQGLPELNGDLHVTITYSRDPVDWIKMGSTWSDAGNDAGGRLTINAGGPRVVEPLGDQAAALMFASSDLSWRHTEMVREGASWDYPDYTPHISLVKSGAVPERIEPYRGKIELGMEIFEELRL